jgi:hypothetical protein
MTADQGREQTVRGQEIPQLGAEERRRELVRTLCALSILDAQHSRALTLARTAGASERADLIAEAHRLTRLSVALAASAATLRALETETGAPPEQDCAQEAAVHRRHALRAA